MNQCNNCFYWEGPYSYVKDEDFETNKRVGHCEPIIDVGHGYVRKIYQGMTREDYHCPYWAEDRTHRRKEPTA